MFRSYQPLRQSQRRIVQLYWYVCSCDTNCNKNIISQSLICLSKDLFAGIGSGIIALKRAGISIKRIIHVEHDKVASHGMFVVLHCHVTLTAVWLMLVSSVQVESCCRILRQWARRGCN
jgi:hypothetical protein